MRIVLLTTEPRYIVFLLRFFYFIFDYVYISMYGVHANGGGCPTEARSTGSQKAGVTGGCAGIEPRSYAGALRALLTTGLPSSLPDMLSVCYVRSLRVEPDQERCLHSTSIACVFVSNTSAIKHLRHVGSFLSNGL